MDSGNKGKLCHEIEKKVRSGRNNKIICAILFLILVCVGCGGMESGKEGDSGIEVFPGEREEKEDFTLQEELRPSILQIYCGDYRGSGVVWKITEREVTVIGSGHLLKYGDTCQVLCYAGIYYEAKVDRILEDCDVGVAVFPAEMLKEDGVELRAVIPSGRKKEELAAGEELVVYGSMDFAEGNFVKGYLIEGEAAIQLEGTEGEQLLMLGGLVRENVDGAGGSAVDAGMSGSGVFDRSGAFLGLLAGGDGESNFAAVPVWQIRTE